LYEEIFILAFAKVMKKVERGAVEKCTRRPRRDKDGEDYEITARNDNTEKKIRCIMELIKRKESY